MKNIQSISFHSGSREEVLPGFAADFPYIASRAEIDKYIGRSVPWHWHRAVELFYIESGTLEYCTPEKAILFPAGSGGMINTNVLHKATALGQTEDNVPLVHLFDASYLAGEQGSRIEKKYITPLTASPMEIVPLFPENAAHAQILSRMKEAFRLTDEAYGYEIKLREVLSEIWLMLFEQARPFLGQDAPSNKRNDKIKQMLIYIQEHYFEKITISELAAAAYLSERECFRVFRDCLHTTPVEYIRNYRLQAACQMLAKGQESLTSISHACGLGSSSYFGKVFREYAHCTPSEYRRKWSSG